MIRNACLIILIALSTETVVAVENTRTIGHDQCGENETWTFGPEIPEESATLFRDLLNKRVHPVLAFSEALALSQSPQASTSPDVLLLAEYWIARSLYEAKLVHIAWNGFEAVIASTPTKNTQTAQIAALECLNQLHRKYPALTFSDRAIERLPELAELSGNSADNGPLWEATETALQIRLNSDSSDLRSSVKPLLNALKGSGAYEESAKALFSIREGECRSAVSHWDRYFKLEKTPKSFDRYKNEFRILFARSLYKTGDFDRAASQLKTRKKEFQ